MDYLWHELLLIGTIVGAGCAGMGCYRDRSALVQAGVG